MNSYENYLLLKNSDIITKLSSLVMRVVNKKVLSVFLQRNSLGTLKTM